MQAGMFPPHPGGMQPGMPHGHPGMPPNPAQHMAQPMQMNPGVSGPGGPHMAQTAMMGMPAGAATMPGGMPGAMSGGPGAAMSMPGQSMAGPGANAMALSHLAPQNSIMAQQQLQASKSIALSAVANHLLTLSCNSGS